MHPFTRAGLRATGWFLFAMGLLSLAATACAVVFGFLPEKTAAALLASLAGTVLTPLYFAVAYELFSHRLWARAAAITLSFAGAGVVLLILLVGLAPTLHSLTLTNPSEILAVAMLVAYGLISIFDLFAILFLLSPRTTAVFLREEYSAAWPDPLSPLELFASAIFRIRF
jgi:hypothetical protein